MPRYDDDDYDDDYEDRPRRRRRDDDDDDDYDDRPRRRRSRDDDDDDYDRPRRSRGGRRRGSGAELTTEEWLLYTLLFLCVPCANVIISSVLYYVWRADYPRKASQINMLGFAIFALNLVIGCTLGILVPPQR